MKNKLIIFCIIFFWGCIPTKIKEERLIKCKKPCGFKDKKGFHEACSYPNPKKGFVKIRGVKYWVEIEGNGPPLLMIQGGPLFDHRYFHPHFSTLSDNHTLIYCDLAGRYISKPLKNNKYGIKNDIIDLDSLRIKLEIDDWSVLGHSFGGYIAMLYANHYPKRTNKLFLVSTPLGIKKDNYDSVRTTVMEKYFSNVSTKKANIKAHKKFNFNKIPESDSLEYWKKTLKSYNNYSYFDTLKKEYIESTREQWVNNIGPEFIETYDSFYNVSIPWYNLIGMKDEIGFQKSTIKATNKSAKGHVIKFYNSKHFPWIEEKEKFFNQLSTILTE